MDELTIHQIDHLNRINAHTRGMLLGEKIQAFIEHINADLPLGNDDEAYVDETAGTPVNAVNASNVMTLTGVVTHGEKVVISNPEVEVPDVYEFLADEAQQKTLAAHIAVNIKAYAVKATRNLTVDTQPSSGDTMTIGTKVFTFVPVGTNTADGEVPIGTDLATAQAAIVAAINGSDGVNDPHPLVTAGAFANDVCAITALIGGAGGNAIATTETFTAGTNVFAGVTLAGGASCSAANAITALVAAITANDTQGVGAAPGAGTTVVFTADVAGVIGNAIILQESLVNATIAAGAELLVGGVDGTVGVQFQSMIDASYLYYAIAANTIAGKNWRRISLGTAY